MDLFLSLNKDGMTIVMVTHSEESAKYARRTLRVSDGLLAGEDRSMEQVGPRTRLRNVDMRKVAYQS
jgi:putative ABC transport system ATP-binding protein